MSLFSYLSTHFSFQLFIWQQMWFQVLHISETFLLRQFQKSTNTKMSGLYFKWCGDLNLMQGRKKSGVVSERDLNQAHLLLPIHRVKQFRRKLDVSISISSPQGYIYCLSWHFMCCLFHHLRPSFWDAALSENWAFSIFVWNLWLKFGPQMAGRSICQQSAAALRVGDLNKDESPVSFISMKNAGVSHAML